MAGDERVVVDRLRLAHDHLAQALAMMDEAGEPLVAALICEALNAARLRLAAATADDPSA